MKKLLIMFFLIPLFSGELNAQPFQHADSTYRDFKLPLPVTYHHLKFIDTLGDSTFVYKVGSIVLSANIFMVDNVEYLILSTDTIIKDRLTGDIWTAYTLPAKRHLTIHRATNQEPIAFMLGEADNSVYCYYSK